MDLGIPYFQTTPCFSSLGSGKVALPYRIPFWSDKYRKRCLTIFVSGLICIGNWWSPWNTHIIPIYIHIPMICFCQAYFLYARLVTSSQFAPTSSISCLAIARPCHISTAFFMTWRGLERKSRQRRKHQNSDPKELYSQTESWNWIQILNLNHANWTKLNTNNMLNKNHANIKNTEIDVFENSSERWAHNPPRFEHCPPLQARPEMDLGSDCFLEKMSLVHVHPLFDFFGRGHSVVRLGEI